MSYSYPAFDGKHAAPSALEPGHDVAASETDPADVPRTAVVCYQSATFAAAEARAETELFPDHPLFDCVRLADAPVAVAHVAGVGAPVAAMVVETLRAAGVDAVLSVGYAGCLQPAVSPSALIVPTTAIRDEGTSHHYLAPGERVDPTPALAGATEAAAAATDRPLRTGPTWSVDAPHRETAPEVQRYADEGVVTVEMEAAAVFAVARRRGFEAAAAFVVSDYVTTDEWDRRFDETADRLAALLDAAVDALRQHHDDTA